MATATNSLIHSVGEISFLTLLSEWKGGGKVLIWVILSLPPSSPLPLLLSPSLLFSPLPSLPFHSPYPHVLLALSSHTLGNLAGHLEVF